CEVAPAFAAAIQTTAPTINATADHAPPTQPMAMNIRHVAMSVAIVIPEIGFAELPINPTMRLDTVTNRKPKMMMRTAAIRFAAKCPGFKLNDNSAQTPMTMASEPDN